MIGFLICIKSGFLCAYGVIMRIIINCISSHFICIVT